MKTSRSDSATNLIRSLIAAKLKIESGVKKDAENANFSSEYASLGAVIDATESQLLAEGLVIVQLPGECIDGKAYLTTQLLHVSGEWIEGTCSAPYEFADPQGYGSVLSFLRRYTMNALLGLYQTDDDANSASGSRRPALTANSRAKDVPPSSVASSTDAKASSSTDKGVTPLGNNEIVSDPKSPRVEQWKKSIANASSKRLELAKVTANTMFSGAALKLIIDLIDRHLVVANQVHDPFGID